MSSLLSRGVSALTLLLALAVMACAGDIEDNNLPDGCTVAITFVPDPVFVTDLPVVARAEVNGTSGTLSYVWTITYQGTAQELQGQQISFTVLDAGTYEVTLAAPASDCSATRRFLNVAAPATTPQPYWLRVTPPPETGLAAHVLPYIDYSNADTSGKNLLLEPVALDAQVRMAGAGKAAYVRFAAPGSTDAIAELSTDAAGRFKQQLARAAYDVLVVPADGTAPQLFARWTPPLVGQATFDVAAGMTVSGAVLDPQGAPLPGARVALHLDGVPSSVGTSAADGSFSVQARAGTRVEVTVTPPTGSGLPRLSGTSTALTLSSGLAIQYDSALATRDLAGLAITLGGDAAPQARVAVVGSVPRAGTVTAGAALDLAGQVRATAIAAGDGRLPGLRVPRASLTAVLQAAGGELAVRALDTMVAPPSALDIGPAPRITGAVQLAPQVPVAGAQVRLEPQGPLAQAGIPAALGTAAADGTFSVAAAQGGSYQVVLSDPRWGGMPLTVATAAPAALGPQTLPARFVLRGAAARTVSNSSVPVASAAVELLCYGCVGLDRQRPISATVTSSDGTYALAVPIRSR